MALSSRRHTFAHKQTLKFQKISEAHRQIDTRTTEGSYERLTNRLQNRLIRAYHGWGRTVKADLKRASERDLPVSLNVLIGARVDALLADLTTILASGIGAAGNLGVGRANARRPVVKRAINQRVNKASDYLHNSLGPDLKLDIIGVVSPAIFHFKLKLPGLTTIVGALAAVIDSYDARVGSYAGTAWATIFDAQAALGEEQEAATGTSQSIRWVLDPAAVHCKPSNGRNGCPELEGEYASWNDLITVPAGEVTCAGNCRCHLEIYVDGDWQRGGL